MFVFVNEGPRARGVGENLFDRRAVFALQAFNCGETAVDCVELGRVVLRRFERPRHVGGKLGRLRLQRRRALRRLAQIAVERGDVGERGAGGPQCRNSAAFFGRERLARVLQRDRDALDVIEKDSAFGQTLVFAGLESRRLDLAARKARLVAAFLRASFVAVQRRESACRIARRGVGDAGGLALRERRIACEPVEDVEMIGGQKQPLRFVLSHDFRNRVAQFAHVRRRRCAPVHPQARASALADLARDRRRLAGVELESVGGKTLAHRIVGFERERDERASCAPAHDVGPARAPSANRGRRQHRLSRARFAGEDRRSVLELDLGTLDQAEPSIWSCRNILIGLPLRRGSLMETPQSIFSRAARGNAVAGCARNARVWDGGANEDANGQRPR